MGAFRRRGVSGGPGRGVPGESGADGAAALFAGRGGAAGDGLLAGAREGGGAGGDADAGAGSRAPGAGDDGERPSLHEVGCSDVGRSDVGCSGAGHPDVGQPDAGHPDAGHLAGRPDAEPPSRPHTPDDTRHLPGTPASEEPGHVPGTPAPEGTERPTRRFRRLRPTPTAPLALQVNALQAMSRQVFGFRLGMIALAAPSALLNASPGVGVRLVGTAVVVTFMVSYALLRDWERFGPLLLRHPSLLAADTLLGSLLLVSAGPDTTLAYVSVCTPLLAGIVYGWRGAACFASAQGLILLLVHTTLEARSGASVAERLLLPGFCVITGALGSALRGLMLRFGEATEALAETRARLAAAEAVAAERARLAREMHDSLAKSLYGVALAAEALAAGADRPVRDQAKAIASAARQAAGESRDLLTDLRDTEGEELDVLDELASRTTDFASRTGLPTTYRATGERSAVPVLPAVARELLTITAEALDNAHRHAHATRVEVSAGVYDGVLRVTVHDDGRGLPPGTSLDALRGAGRFGLLGMTERAATLGARLSVGADGRGTEVRLELELPPERGPLTGLELPPPVGQFGQGAA